jgi:hypothetical protein
MPIGKKEIIIAIILMLIPYVGWLLAIGFIADKLIKDERQGRGKTPESHSPSPALPMLPA